ncbi:hypothetical protein J2Z53_000724 [Clostridium moniliforme]|uniref:Uncharacterized protein n=1 Tax=Clostridium moniliforme TaxID=39489 RepID=A0ABS4EYR1_9CLOT|nr:hypothetical protein [Clostridium moniliforme]
MIVMKIRLKLKKKNLKYYLLVYFKGYIYGIIEDFEKILKVNNNCELIIIGAG